MHTPVRDSKNNGQIKAPAHIYAAEDSTVPLGQVRPKIRKGQVLRHVRLRWEQGSFLP